ncbi:LUC7 related protein [Actinidia rufa]|uniref:LUC7 related protein n=1 Tax=Actinidia rufa TaxID=165716 RepID=A0A7J0GKR2_9ERIC|nr:LUC7 related protein [Actinidia rufa]
MESELAPRQEPVLDSSKYTAADVRITDQKLRVCDICGAFLSVYDSFQVSQYCSAASAILSFYVVFSDRRLADHFGGKLHLGYMQIRAGINVFTFFCRDSQLICICPIVLAEIGAELQSCLTCNRAGASRYFCWAILENNVFTLCWHRATELGHHLILVGELEQQCTHLDWAYLDFLLFRSYQKNVVENMIGQRAGIVIVERAVNGGGIVIVGAKTVIDIMIMIMDMIESVKERKIGPTAMIQGVAGGHARGQGTNPRTLTATGSYFLHERVQLFNCGLCFQSHFELSS